MNLLNVFPPIFSDYLSNGFYGNAILRGQFAQIRMFAKAINPSDIAHNIFRKNCLRQLLTFELTPFGNFIKHVVTAGANKQVRWVNAVAYIAMMKSAQSHRNLDASQVHGYTMAHFQDAMSASTTKHSVSISILCPTPKPALVWRGLLNILPKAFNVLFGKRWNGKNCNRQRDLLRRSQCLERIKARQPCALVLYSRMMVGIQPFWGFYR